MYYNSPAERAKTVRSHGKILAAARRGDADALVAELDAHRDRALRVLTGILAESGSH
jgi:DNA-binding GntR family transcriptional regulator